MPNRVQAATQRSLKMARRFAVRVHSIIGFLPEAVAWVVYALSKVHLAPPPMYSTCIGEWTTCGYGLDHNGFFRFPLPKLARDMDAKIQANAEINGDSPLD